MIQLGGLASGLDTAAIIEAILGVERVPINALEADKREAEGRLSLMGTLKGHVQSLRDKAEELSTLAGFYSYVVTPSEEGVASFSVTGAPETGSHNLIVNQLASASRFTFSDSVTDPDLDLGAGDINFNVNGTAYNLTVADTDSSLNEIRDAINSLAGDDVSATVVNLGTSASPQYQLVIAGEDTGLEGAITGLTSTVAGLTDVNIVELTTAQNAEVEIDGLTVQRSSNVFDDVLEGLSFTAQAADVSKSISFSTAVDNDGIKTKVQGFVDAYNEVIGFINDQSTFSEEDGAGGALFGDSILRSIKSTLSSSLFSVDISTVIADTAGFSTLSLLGVDLGTDGTLSIDSVKFDAKLEEDPEAFADLFVDTDGFDNTGAANNTQAFFTDLTTDDGLFDNLFRAIDQSVDDLVLGDGSSLKGLFSLREQTINDRISEYNDRIETLEERLIRTEESLIARFSALESLIAGLNAQGSSLQNIQSVN